MDKSNFDKRYDCQGESRAGKKARISDNGIERFRSNTKLLEQKIEKEQNENKKRSDDSITEMVITRDVQARNLANSNIAVSILYEKCRFCGSTIIKHPQKSYSLYKSDYPESQTSCMERLGSGKYMCFSSEGSDLETVSDKVLNREELVNTALKYEQQIREEGCMGICILFDTKQCTGESYCKNFSKQGCVEQCNAHKTDLCAREYLLRREYPNLLERDGGDYRSLIGNYLRRLKENPQKDMEIVETLKRSEIKSNEFEAEVYKYLVQTQDSNLLLHWKACTIESFLNKFPDIDRKPTRIELQILLYMFQHYRSEIDLAHLEERFLISRDIINRYLKLFFDCSYSKLLNMIRNEHSKYLLRIPILRIGEISVLVGYRSNYHYSLSFKRLEGISPKEYRAGISRA